MKHETSNRAWLKPSVASNDKVKTNATLRFLVNLMFEHLCVSSNVCVCAMCGKLCLNFVVVVVVDMSQNSSKCGKFLQDQPKFARKNLVW